MKTSREIETEAQRLTVLGREYLEKQAGYEAHGGIAPVPRLLVQFAKSWVAATHVTEPQSQSVHPYRHERYLDATIQGGELIYRLMERRMETASSVQRSREDVPSVVMTSRSSFDPLRMGYELVEEERLAELLAPYAERSDDSNCTDPADPKTVGEVEAILETGLLPYSDRIRTRAEITEFLEGRLEPSVFIGHAVERQCSRDDRRERLTERHEIKLANDEP